MSHEQHGIAIIVQLRHDVLTHPASSMCLQVLDAETQADQDDEAEEYIEADEEEQEEEEEDVDLEREMEYEDDEVSQQASQMHNDSTSCLWELTSIQRMVIAMLLGFCQWHSPTVKHNRACYRHRGQLQCLTDQLCCRYCLILYGGTPRLVAGYTFSCTSFSPLRQVKPLHKSLHKTLSTHLPSS